MRTVGWWRKRWRKSRLGSWSMMKFLCEKMGETPQNKNLELARQTKIDLDCLTIIDVHDGRRITMDFETIGR